MSVRENQLDPHKPDFAVEYAALTTMELLRQFAGFRSSEHIESKLKRIFQGTDRDRLKGWVDHLKSDPESSEAELMALIEDVSNRDTYFFRDYKQLSVLLDVIFPEMIRKKLREGDCSIRIWSAGCSTGEEAYSLAMLLTMAMINAKVAFAGGEKGEVFFPAHWNLEVIGADISRQSIRIAKDAAYKRGGFDSFREFPEEYMMFMRDLGKTDDSQLNPAKTYYQVCESIKQVVSFQNINFVRAQAPSNDFDLVTCRNTLIAIDDEFQSEIQRMFHDALKEDSYLLMSPCDQLHYPHGFKKELVSGSTFFRKVPLAAA